MRKIISTLATVTLLSVSAMAEDVSTYLISASTSLSDVQSKLKANGFEVLATTDNVVTITNPELKASDTYVATLQVYVGDKDVRVQNPAYFGAAYLQDAYKKGQFKNTVDALTKALGTMTGSKEKLDSSDISGYHFMMSMPYFDDAVTVIKSDNVYKKVQGNSEIAYSLQLPGGALLVGHKLSPTTSAFLGTLGQTNNSQILPYEALVYSNQVSMMDPKYYLALSLPELSIGDFMKISSVPDKIEADIKKAYQ
jgi:hypothetical protein